MTPGRRADRTSVRALTAMVLTAALLALGSRGSVGAAGVADAPAVVAWEQWQHVPGVIDLAGPRRDGRLVAAANGRLVLIDPATGSVTAFAPTYSVPTGPESYIAMSPGLAVDGTHCRFRRDDVFALDDSAPLGVKRITARGTVSELATIPGVTVLTGIAFDTVGRFGYRLLVMGLSEPGTTRVSAVDCRGKVTSIGVVDIALEGGMAVAPRDFGLFGGQLFAASEATGEIVAISPRGLLSAVAPSGVEAGPDIGVQGVGFVPAQGTPTAYPGRPRWPVPTPRRHRQRAAPGPRCTGGRGPTR